MNQKLIFKTSFIILIVLILPLTLSGRKLTQLTCHPVFAQSEGNVEDESDRQVFTEEAAMPEDPTTEIPYADSYERIKAQSLLKIFSETTEDQAVEAIYQGIMAHKTQIDLLQYNLDEGMAIELVSKAMAKDLYLYNLQPIAGYTWSYYEDGVLLYIKINYRLTGDQITQRYQALKQVVAERVLSLENLTDSWEIVLALYEQLIYDSAYDYDNYLNNTIPVDSYYAYGILVDHTGVCNAYALAMNLILSELDINCFKVESDTMHHAWNMVQLDGNWYHLDATWDETTPDTPYYIKYKYFLLNDTEMTGANHSGWDAQGVSASSTIYSSMPRNSNNIQDYINGRWYVANNGELNSYNRYGADKRLHKSGFHLYGIQEMGDYVYYGLGEEIIQWDMKYNTSKTIYTMTAEETMAPGIYYAFIYGLCPVSQNELGYRYSSEDGGNGFGHLAVQTKRSNIKVEGVTLNKNQLTIMADHDEVLTAMITPDDAENQELSWKSDNESIAIVDQTGKVTGISLGTTIITVTTSDGGFTAACEVTVTENTGPKIKVDNMAPVVKVGRSKEVMVTFENTGTIEGKWYISCIGSNKNVSLKWKEWETNNKQIGLILTGVSEGNTKITVYIKQSETGGILAIYSFNVQVNDFIAGDVNDDGTFTFEDAIFAKGIAMKGINASEDQISNGDFNSDGKITINEARKIKRAVNTPSILN